MLTVKPKYEKKYKVIPWENNFQNYTIENHFIIYIIKNGMIIYKITNKINNKVYIGLTTTTLQYRWSKHIAESKNVKNTKHLYKAIRKYEIKLKFLEKKTKN